MIVATLGSHGDAFEAWRAEARRLLAQGAQPADVVWSTDAAPSLFANEEAPGRGRAREAMNASAVNHARVPAAFVELARVVAFHRDDTKWALLYRVLFRLTHGEPHLLEVATDADVSRLGRMEQAISRDEHKMHAFVRFRRVVIGDVEHFVAWHRPDHPVLRLVAPFFARRFPGMLFAIATPDESVTWDGRELVFGAGMPRHEAPEEDGYEALFRTYYESIYNPARVNVRAMAAHMPKKHWATMPETGAVPGLVRLASERTRAMAHANDSGAASFVPSARDIDALRASASQCRACPLFAAATQTVFGEGPPGASVMLVGEQPGDQEDLAGRPFVGPAGLVLERAMERAGLPRTEVYLTNAVKHFKFEQRGKRRIHSRPTYDEIGACRAWLDAELESVKPQIIVCLGSTAAQSFFGAKFRVSRERGKLFATRWAPWLTVTWHPSMVLRAVDDASRERARAELEADLALAADQWRALRAVEEVR